MDKKMKQIIHPTPVKCFNTPPLLNRHEKNGSHNKINGVKTACL